LVLHFDVALILFRQYFLVTVALSALILTERSCLSLSSFVGVPDAVEGRNANWYFVY